MMNCSLFSDVMYAHLPAQISAGQNYPLFAASDNPGVLSSSCGDIQTLADGTAILKTYNIISASCQLSVNNTVIWNMTQQTQASLFTNHVLAIAYGQIALPTNAVVTSTIGTPIAPVALATLAGTVRWGSGYLSCIYINLTALPDGIVLDAQHGMIYGVPQAATIGSSVVVFAVYDTVSHVHAVIGQVTFRFTQKPSSSSVNVAAYIAPIAFVALAFIVILGLLFLHERRKNMLRPHNFAEMLAALSDLKSEGEKRVPREMKRQHIRLIDKLGEGNFGEVFKGLLDEIPGTPGYIVAVKSLKADGLFAVNAQQGQMLQEAALMAQFEHPHVVRLIGVVTLGDPLLVALEYCEHGVLNKFLQFNKDLTYNMFHRLSLDCASGMAYLASHRFVHRDLAARNVLLDSEYRCKISDFGMSRETMDSNYYQSRGGQLPVRWTAPEALEERKFSEQSDVWSFGVLMYEIWTHAETPYNDMSNQRVWTEVLGGYRLPCPPECTEETYLLMRQCWTVCGHRPTFEELVVKIRELNDATCLDQASELLLKMRGSDGSDNSSFIKKTSAVYADFLRGRSGSQVSPPVVRHPPPTVVVVPAPIQRDQQNTCSVPVPESPRAAAKSHLSHSQSQYANREVHTHDRSWSDLLLSLGYARHNDDEVNDEAGASPVLRRYTAV